MDRFELMTSHSKQVVIRTVDHEKLLYLSSRFESTHWAFLLWLLVGDFSPVVCVRCQDLQWYTSPPSRILNVRQMAQAMMSRCGAVDGACSVVSPTMRRTLGVSFK